MPRDNPKGTVVQDIALISQGKRTSNTYDINRLRRRTFCEIIKSRSECQNPYVSWVSRASKNPRKGALLQAIGFISIYSAFALASIPMLLGGQGIPTVLPHRSSG